MQIKYRKILLCHKLCLKIKDKQGKKNLSNLKESSWKKNNLFWENHKV